MVLPKCIANYQARELNVVMPREPRRDKAVGKSDNHLAGIRLTREATDNDEQRT
jgi:hypothetical protein